MIREPWRFRRLSSSETLSTVSVSPIPASPSLDLRYMSDEEPVVDANFREIVESLMWIANQTKPDISNAVRAIAPFSHDPKEVHVRAARKVLEYLSATAHLGLTFRKDSKLGDVQLEYDLEAYVDAGTPTRPRTGVRYLV